MARQYSAKTFFRNAPNALLAEYFEHAGANLDIPWGDLRETEVEPIFEAMEGLDHEPQSRIEGDLRFVNELACEAGVQAILEEARSWGRDWSEQFAEMKNHYERALWTFLHEPTRFEAAGRFHEMDRVGGWWRRFVGKRLDASTEPEAIEALKQGVSHFYRRQGRGRRCEVDPYQREAPDRACYFAYPEDYATDDLGYDDKGRLQRRPRRSVFEVIFVYRPEEGMLEMHARGDKKQKEALAEIFCTAILGLTALPDDSGRPPYDLSILKDPAFKFETEPQDRIASVVVRQLRLDLPKNEDRGRNPRMILMTTPTPASPRALYRLLEKSLSPDLLRLGDVDISNAKLTFTFRPLGDKRPKTLTFEVTYPDRCTLKDDPYDQIARKCLRKWTIARD